MRLRSTSAAALTSLLLASTANAARPSYNARYDAVRRAPAAPIALRAAVRAPAPLVRSPEHVARFFLGRFGSASRLPSAASDGAEVRAVHDRGRGPIVVTFRQRIDGVEVWNDDVKVLLDRNLDLRAVSGRLHEAQAAGRFTLTHADAAAVAFSDLNDVPLSAAGLAQERTIAGGYHAFDLKQTAAVRAKDLVFQRPTRAKRVLFPLPAGLARAYYVEVFSGRFDAVTGESYAYVIGAADGRILYRNDLTHTEAFDYRVWADATGDHRPFDGPVADFTPHPTGTPDGSFPAFVAPSLITMDGFNTNPSGTFDPWLPAGATETKGNNVDAYTDHDAPNGFTAGVDLRGTTTSPGAFDRVYDPLSDPLADEDQSRAAITQMFYVNNWLHDYYYDSGFDEASGNAQVDNYGRGGMEGDPLLAEGQDGVLQGNLNNANMATPADGFSPRMQMYVYTGEEDRTLEVQPLDATYPNAGASFGPQTFDVTADIVLVDDGTAPTANACEAITNNVSGAIALIDRGDCSFLSKVARAEAAGAVGVIIVNNTPNEGPPQMGGAMGNDPTIGVLSVSLSDGNAIKSAIGGATQTATLERSAGPRADGTLDNLIVAHEWGHYMHLRLVTCSSNQCGSQSEGWADFIALHMALRESDDISGTFADAVYAPYARPNAAYFGVRRLPYSIDKDKNAYTFRHIANGVPLPSNNAINNTGVPNAEVHNSGEVWASMLFEGYAGMIARTTGPNPAYTFDEARRRMADYMVAGMKLAPADPTYTEQRDALLAAAAAADQDDMLALAQGFATRGAGSCAESPPRDSTDHVGVVESFEVAPFVAVDDVTLSEADDNCDGDGTVDAGEQGIVELTFANNGPVALDAATLTVSTVTDGVTFLDPATIELEDLPPFSSQTLSWRVVVAADVDGVTPFELRTSVDAPSACNEELSRSDFFRLNSDELLASSTEDVFDAKVSAWIPRGTEPDVVWAQVEPEALDGMWRGIDLGRLSDTWLESPSLEVGGDGSLVMTMEHRYSFEVDLDTPIYWDGGVIEISRDGVNWEDASDYATLPYDGPISNEASSPLSDRMALVASNAAWPERETLTVDFGPSFAGETVKVRFRIGTDEAAGGFGWEIARVAFDGIVNTPFSTVVDDATQCKEPPTADAGPDQTVTSGDTVVLDGSGSLDPEGDPLTYSWAVIDGPGGFLGSGDDAVLSFLAPPVTSEVQLTFELTVDDGTTSASDTVIVTIVPNDGLVTGNNADLSGRACLCVAPGHGGPSPSSRGWLLPLLASGLWWRRRRRDARV